MRVVRTGVTRTVILTRRWAIKVPSLRGVGVRRSRVASFVAGLLANLSEAEWSGSPGTCPVRLSIGGGLINVYPRCGPVDPGERVDYAAIGLLGPGDNKPSNIGRLDGRLVWIDYDMSDVVCLACRNRSDASP